MSSSIVENEFGAWDDVAAALASMRLLTARGRTRGRGACCSLSSDRYDDELCDTYQRTAV
jgi:hypothetical protein